jgi:cobalt transporter subunit CbtB
MTQTRTMSGSASTADHVGILAPVVLAVLLGAFLIFGTGLSTISAAHNAAHDARHAFAFPCH